MLGRHYANAPIAEAILELRVECDDFVGLSDLTAVAADGDTTTPMRLFDGHFTPADDESGASVGELAGYTVNQGDSSRFCFVGLDRFAFAQRGPYEGWESFDRSADAAWTRYKAVARPVVVSTASVRFVNHIQLPARVVEIRDYLRTTVELSAYLPQSVSDMFMQVEVPFAEVGTVARISSSFIQGLESPALLLDIDVRADVALSPRSESFDTDLRATLAALRNTKNYVFEACITDATRGLIG